jgi:hypothetical protein
MFATLTPAALRSDDLAVTFSLRDALVHYTDNADLSHLQLWRCQLERSTLGRSGTIAEAHIWVVDAGAMSDPDGLFESFGPELEHLNSHVLVDNSDLHHSLGGGLEHQLPGKFLDIRSVTAHPDYAGLGLEQLLVSAAIGRLGAGVNLALLNPSHGVSASKGTVAGTPQHYAAVRHAADPWLDLGFEMFATNLLVADLTRANVREMLAAPLRA